MKLTAEQIEFIDKFLKRNDVVFVDIRAEMIDHIASAVEEKMQNEEIDFYDALRRYVIPNKKEIFKRSRNTDNWLVSFSEMKPFLFFLLRPKNLIVFVILAVLFQLFQASTYFLTFKDSFFIYFIILFGFIVIIQFVYFYLIKKKRFYFIEKNAKTLLVLYWLGLFLLRPFNEAHTINNYGFLVFIYLLVVFFLYMTIEIKAFVESKLYTL